ncbi:MAG: F0F1 ATP synthase subunit epsilon [Syntrophobacterales bacterium]|nr:F0F1 ATP synthase subunit epsilon [Syntrophobacterales bacterium]
MPTEMTLEIVTPEGIAFNGVVDEVTVPGTEGEFGVLKGHAPMLGSIGIGTLSILRDRKRIFYAVNTGYAKVSPSKVTLLLETAERADLIDRERAEKALQRAEQKLGQLSRDDIEFEKAQAALRRAIVRINTSGRS